LALFGDVWILMMKGVEREIYNGGRLVAVGLIRRAGVYSAGPLSQRIDAVHGASSSPLIQQSMKFNSPFTFKCWQCKPAVAVPRKRLSCRLDNIQSI